MKNRTDRAGANRPSHPTPTFKKEPLSDSRFQDLLSRAGAFFADAEREVEGERAAMIQEILQTLDRYGLTVADLK